MKYLLDTDSVRSAPRGEGQVAGRITSHEPSEMCISAIDVLIAAHAASLRCTLVTNNVRHFSKVPGLALENWK